MKIKGINNYIEKGHIVLKKCMALIVLFLLLFSSPLEAKEDEAIQKVEPVIEIVYPRSGFLSLHDQITIVGRVRFVRRLQIGEKVITLDKDKLPDVHEFKLEVDLKNKGLNIIDIYYVSSDGKIKKQRMDIYYESMPKGREKILIGTEKFLKETQEYEEERIKSYLIFGKAPTVEEEKVILKEIEKEKEIVRYIAPVIEITYPRNGYLSLKEQVIFKVKTQFTRILQIGEKMMSIKKSKMADVEEFEMKVDLKNEGLNIVDILYAGLDKEVHKQQIHLYYEPMPIGREQILIGTEKYLKEMLEYKKEEERDYY